VPCVGSIAASAALVASTIAKAESDKNEEAQFAGRIGWSPLEKKIFRLPRNERLCSSAIFKGKNFLH
jgi:hypothetical protein